MQTNTSTSNLKMGELLEHLGLERLVKSFQEEKVTPDIVGKLSTTQMEYLGLTDRADMMKLRRPFNKILNSRIFL